MRRILQLLLMGFTVVPVILAGSVYGTIREGNRPLAGVPVSLTCGKEAPVSGTADTEGVYRLFTRATGACQLVVDLPGRRMSASVYSYDRPTAYDFDVVREGEGWVLRKR
jgi:hypothetical protein